MLREVAEPMAPRRRLPRVPKDPLDRVMANLPTNIVDFRGFDSSLILIFKGWNFQAHRGFPGFVYTSRFVRVILAQGPC